MIRYYCYILFVLLALPLAAQDYHPRVLVVTAHPDDETGMAGAIYKITHELHGAVDQCVITNGEGGYKYSTLGNAYYGLELTDEKIGRAHLPRIRKQELMNAGKIIGMGNIYFLDQRDAHYGLNEHEPLDTTWHVSWVSERLHDLMVQGKYDFVFCLLPVPETHAHHKAATLLALRASQTLPMGNRPIVLGVSMTNKTDTVVPHFTQLKDYKESHVNGDSCTYRFDRNQSFGYKNTLNYKMIANWEIAEHKSQGSMQLAIGHGDYECYWLFSINAADAKQKCETLFNTLAKNTYPKLVY
jgi:N-acetylglucosamine malate deacetylase 2